MTIVRAVWPVWCRAFVCVLFDKPSHFYPPYRTVFFSSSILYQINANDKSLNSRKITQKSLIKKKRHRTTYKYEIAVMQIFVTLFGCVCVFFMLYYVKLNSRHKTKKAEEKHDVWCIFFCYFVNIFDMSVSDLYDLLRFDGSSDMLKMVDSTNYWVAFRFVFIFFSHCLR